MKCIKDSDCLVGELVKYGYGKFFINRDVIIKMMKVWEIFNFDIF